MTYPPHHAAPCRAQGFILVTSLVFLVVITLIAVSAISSSTLQERMASNLREKSRALQAANATLRHGERLLQNPVFNTPQTPGTSVALAQAGQSTNSNATSMKLSTRDGMFGSDKNNDSAAFLNPAVWAANSAMSRQVDPTMPDVKYYVEDYKCLATDLKSDSAATCAGGVIVYRITARAQGQSPAAIAVTQSLYGKHY